MPDLKWVPVCSTGCGNQVRKQAGHSEHTLQWACRSTHAKCPSNVMAKGAGARPVALEACLPCCGMEKTHAPPAQQVIKKSVVNLVHTLHADAFKVRRAGAHPLDLLRMRGIHCMAKDSWRTMHSQAWMAKGV
eukprot:scaffold248431_cov21-Tisochrysis_lutea.AAC.1